MDNLKYNLKKTISRIPRIIKKGSKKQESPQPQPELRITKENEKEYKITIPEKSVAKVFLNPSLIEISIS